MLFDFTKNKETAKENKLVISEKVKYDNFLCATTRDMVEVLKGGELKGGELKAGEQYRIVSEKSFNAIVVLDYFNRIYKLTEVVMAVYRINYIAVDALVSMIENNEFLTMQILLSSFFRENRRYEKWCETLTHLAKEQPRLRVGFAHNHAKVFLAKTECGKNIVFEGSGNLSDNARIEQYTLEDNEQVYDFHRNWIINQINKN